MNKQPEMVTALYYRAARKNDTDLNLDNQMYQLLRYAQQHEIGSFVLYADNGASGLTLARPALMTLWAHPRPVREAGDRNQRRPHQLEHAGRPAVYRRRRQARRGGDLRPGGRRAAGRK